MGGGLKRCTRSPKIRQFQITATHSMPQKKRANTRLTYTDTQEKKEGGDLDLVAVFFFDTSDIKCIAYLHDSFR